MLNLNIFTAEENDPTTLFLQKEVQSILKALTRKDLSKIYKKKKLGQKQLEQPVYKFMTDKELKETLDDAHKKADEMLQMPPVLPVRKTTMRILSRDPALQGFDKSRFVFTDITFGIPDTKRTIVVRETDGTLQEADRDVRNRMNQLYFPQAGRQLTMPQMFQQEYLDDLLSRQEYEFILDRACIQFEPDDAEYQRICALTYNQVNENSDFDHLRSTRHFGPLVFYLAWHKNIDNLLLELIETCCIDEAMKLVCLYGKLNKIDFVGEDAENYVKQYVEQYSQKKGSLLLALQAYKDVEQQKRERESGIRTAHGI